MQSITPYHRGVAVTERVVIMARSRRTVQHRGVHPVGRWRVPIRHMPVQMRQMTVPIWQGTVWIGQVTVRTLSGVCIRPWSGGVRLRRC